MLTEFFSQLLRHKFAAVCAGLLVLSGCDYFIRDSVTYYQKLSVTVEVDGKIVVGESVIKVWYMLKKKKFLPEERISNTSLAGEAVTIDLGKGHYLFALLKDPRGTPKTRYDAEFIGKQTFKDLLPARKDFPDLQGDKNSWAWSKFYLKTLGQIRGAREPVRMPLFVTFSDVNNPETVKAVNPYNMLTAFPKGTFAELDLKDITLELVDKQPLTEKVESVLGWLDKYKNQQLNGDPNEHIDAQNRFANSLSSGNFIVNLN